MRGRARAARVAERLAGRVAETSGLAEVEELERRVAPVAEAITENAALAGPLERLVARLEQDLVPLLERVVAPSAGAPDDDS